QVGGDHGASLVQGGFDWGADSEAFDRLQGTDGLVGLHGWHVGLGIDQIDSEREHHVAKRLSGGFDSAKGNAGWDSAGVRIALEVIGPGGGIDRRRSAIPATEVYVHGPRPCDEGGAVDG